MLNHNGKLIGDFTVALLGARRPLLRGRHAMRRRCSTCAGSSRYHPTRRAARRGPSLRHPNTPAFRHRGPAESRDLLQQSRDAGRSRDRGLPVHERSGKTEVGTIPAFRRSGLLHGRPRLRDLGARRTSQRALYDAALTGKTGAPLWPAELVGRPRAARHAAREEASAPGRASSGRSMGRTRPGLDRFVALKQERFRRARSRRQGQGQDGGGSLRLVTFAVEAAWRRCDRRRARVARWQGRRLGDVWRLRPWRRPIAGIGLCAEGPRYGLVRIRDRVDRRAPTGEAPRRRGLRPSRDRDAGVMRTYSGTQRAEAISFSLWFRCH